MVIKQQNCIILVNIFFPNLNLNCSTKIIQVHNGKHKPKNIKQIHTHGCVTSIKVSNRLTTKRTRPQNWVFEKSPFCCYKFPFTFWKRVRVVTVVSGTRIFLKRPIRIPITRTKRSNPVIAQRTKSIWQRQSFDGQSYSCLGYPFTWLRTGQHFNFCEILLPAEQILIDSNEIPGLGPEIVIS